VDGGTGTVVFAGLLVTIIFASDAASAAGAGTALPLQVSK